MNVCFKITSGQEDPEYCFSLYVECLYHEERYIYLVKATSYGSCFSNPVGAKAFTTPQEAFDFAQLVVKKYPQFGDEKDFDYKLFPEFDINEIEEPRPNSDFVGLFLGSLVIVLGIVAFVCVVLAVVIKFWEFYSIFVS